MRLGGMITVYMKQLRLSKLLRPSIHSLQPCQPILIHDQPSHLPFKVLSCRLITFALLGRAMILQGTVSPLADDEYLDMRRILAPSQGVLLGIDFH